MTSTTYSGNCVKQGLKILGWTIKSNRTIIIIYLSILAFFGFVNTALGLGVENFDGMINVHIPLSAMTLEAFFTAHIIGFVLAVKAFSYLHSKRQTDLFGALPVSRRTLFFSRAASVILTAGAPMAAFMMVMNIFWGQNELTTFGANNYIMTLEAVSQLTANVAMFGLLSICCGKSSDKIVSFVFINIGYPLTVAFLMLLPTSILWGYGADLNLINQLAAALSPAMSFRDNYTVYWIIFSAVCFGISFVLVKRRRAESAQSEFAFRLPMILTKVLVTLSAGLTVGFTLVMTEMNGGADYLNFWIGMLAGSLAAFVIIQLVFAHGIRGFWKGLITYGITVGCAAVFFAMLAAGWFGYESYVPKAEDVKSISFTDDVDFIVDGVNITDHECTDKEVIKKAVESHKSDVVDMMEFKKRSMKRNLTTKIGYLIYEPGYEYAETSFDAEPTGYYVTYTLNNGQKVKRAYLNIYDETGAGDELFPDFVKTDEFRENYLPIFIIDDKYVMSVTVDGGDDEVVISDPEKCSDIAKTIREEYEKYGYGTDTKRSITIEYGSKDEFGTNYLTQMSFNVPREYARTVELLEAPN